MATTIEYTVQAGDILGVGDAAGYDAEASARAYAALLETELAAAYPDATISVRVARTSGGREIAAYVTDADGLPGDDAPVREQWSVTFVSNFVGTILIAPLMTCSARLAGSRLTTATTRPVGGKRYAACRFTNAGRAAFAANG